MHPIPYVEMRGKGAGFAYDVPFHNPSAPRTDYAPLTTITKEPGMMYVHSAYWQYTHNKQTCATSAINSPLRRDVRTYVCPRQLQRRRYVKLRIYVPPGLSAHGTYPPTTLLLTQVTGIQSRAAAHWPFHAVAAPATALRPLGRTLFRHRVLHFQAAR